MQEEGMEKRGRGGIDVHDDRGGEGKRGMQCYALPGGLEGLGSQDLWRRAGRAGDEKEAAMTRRVQWKVEWRALGSNPTAE